MGNLMGRDHLRKYCRCIWEDDIKMYIRQYDVKGLAGFSCLRIRSAIGLLSA
jgi:hypothetical protein